MSSTTPNQAQQIEIRKQITLHRLNVGLALTNPIKSNREDGGVGGPSVPSQDNSWVTQTQTEMFGTF